MCYFCNFLIIPMNFTKIDVDFLNDFHFCERGELVISMSEWVPY